MFSSILAAVAISTSASTFAFDPTGFDIATLRQLAERGTAVIVDQDPKGAIKLVTAGIVVDAPPQKVFDAATQWEKLPEFMPQVDEAKIVDKKDDHVDVELKLKFSFALGLSTSMRYTERITTTSPSKIDMRFVAGDLTRGGCAYRLVPLDGGTKTLMFYSTISDLRQTGMMVRSLLKQQPTMEAALHVSTASVVALAVKHRAESTKVAEGSK